MDPGLATRFFSMATTIISAVFPRMMYPNNFVASYTVEIPFDLMFKKDNRLTRGWMISGITSLVNGVPVQILEPDDQSLMGNTGNSPFYGSTDAPELAPGNINGDHNPRHGKPWFNTSLFSQEVLGTQGNSPRRFFHGPGVNNTDLALVEGCEDNVDNVCRIPRGILQRLQPCAVLWYRSCGRELQ